MPDCLPPIVNWGLYEAPLGTLYAHGFREVSCEYTASGNNQVQSSASQQTSRCRRYFPQACSNLVAVYSNYNWNTASGVDPLLIGATLELVNNAGALGVGTGPGTFVPFKFPGGLDLYRLEPGGQVATLPLGISIPAGSHAYIRTYVSTLGTNHRASVAISATTNSGNIVLAITNNGGAAQNATVAYNATLDAIKIAIEALANVGAGNVRVWGGTGTGATFYLEFLNGCGGRLMGVADGGSTVNGTALVYTATQTGAAGANRWPIGVICSNQGNEAYNNLADLRSSGASSTFGNNNSFVFGPTATLGQPLSPNGPSVYWAGDSIAFGNSDSPGQTNDGYNNSGWGSGAGGGWVTRFMGFPPACPYLKGARLGHDIASENSFSVVSTGLPSTDSSFRLPMYGACKYNVLQLGTNDIFTSGRSLATLQAMVATWVKAVQAQGQIPIACTLLPRPASTTDAWATVANQTLDGTLATGHEGVRQTYNTWLRANYQAQGFAYLLDVARCAEHSTDGTLANVTGKWAVGGGVVNAYNNAAPGSAPTADGTHPNSVGHIQIAAQLIAAGGGNITAANLFV